MPSNRSSWATSEAPAGDTASRPRDRHKIPLARFANEKSGKLESANSQSQKTTEGQTKEATTETSVKSPDVKFEKRSKKAQKKSKGFKKGTKKGGEVDGTSAATGRVPPKITRTMKKRRNWICLGVTAVLFIAALIVIAFVVGVVVVLPKFDTTAEAAKPTTLVPPRIPTTTINPPKPPDTTSMPTTTTQSEASKLEAAIRKDFRNDEATKYQEEVYEIGGAYPNVTNLKLLSTTWQIPTENYRPLGYQLRLFVRLPGYGIDDAPIPKKLHWTTLGKVRILIEIDKNPENFIELHSKNLKIKAATLREVQLKNKNEDAIFKYKLVGQTRRLAFQHNEQIERVGFGDGKPILAGKYILEIVYDGEINNTLTGLYSSCTTDSQIKKGSCIATTQMEPTNARMMVPCFDEPRFKAIWSLIIFHPTGTEANSNMNSEFSEIDSITGSEARLTWNITKFANTPKMSSYLLALVVHAWEGPDTITTNNVEIRVYAHPSKKGQTAYAKEIASKALSSFEQFFGVKYPLPKLDLFAVARYEEGAMENWGLMIFKERWLLVDPKHESVSEKIQIRNTINHEIGHQWFGNLVTMNWWNEIWLNEGFADFAEFLGRLSHMSFDDAVIEYLLNERNKIMYGEGAYAQKRMVEDFKQKYPDGRYNRYPRTPIEIRYMFDMHAYAKGGLGIFSIFKALGPHRFFTNIKAYLDKHKYSTSHSMDVLGEDLFKDQLWINAQKILEDHLTNIGLPLLIVSHPNERQYRITQKRFVYPQDQPLALPQKYWNLELYFKNEDTKKLETRQFPDLKPDKKEKGLIERNLISAFPPIINMDGRAYTRVCYGKNWPLVFQAFRFARFPLLTRILIYDDLFSMAAAGRVNYGIALEFAYSRLKKDVESDQRAFQHLANMVKEVLDRVLNSKDRANVDVIYKALDELFKITKGEVVRDKKSYAKKSNTYEIQLMEIAEMKASETEYRLAHTREKLLNFMDQLQPNSSKLEDAKQLYIERAFNPCKADQQLSECVLDIPFGAREKFYTDAILSESDDNEMIAEHLSRKLEIETDINEAEKIACALASSKKWKYQEMILNDLIQSLSRPTRVSLQSVEKVMKCLKKNGEKKSHRVDYLLNNTQHIYRSLKGSQNAMIAVYKGLVAGVQSEDDIQKVKEKLESSELDEHPEIRKLQFWGEAVEEYNIKTYWHAHMKEDVLEFYRKRFSAPLPPVRNDPAHVDGE